MRRSRTRFAKDLGLTDSVLLGVGFIIGSGIFLFPILMASKAGTFSLVAWVIGGIYTILTGLCFAENAQRKPKAGGLYSYAHDAFGDGLGFVTGWSFWIGYLVTITTETVAVSFYLKFFLTSFPDTSRLIIAIIITLALTFFNYRGVKLGGRIEDSFTIGKLIPLLIFVVVGAFLLNSQNYYPLLPSSSDIQPASAIGAVTILALWAYLGIEIITVPDEEIKEAKRTVPRAIVIGVLVVMSIYLLVSAVALGLGHWENFVNSESPLADLFQAATQKYVGAAGGTLMALGGLISIIGALNAVILGASRILFAMSRDGIFPKEFHHLHDKFRTPDRAMALQTILAIALLLALSNITSLASLAVLFTIIPYLFSTLATIKIIRKDRWKTHILHTRLIPFLAVAFSVGLLFYIDPGILFLGLLILGAGVVFYTVEERWFRNTVKTKS